MALANNPFTFPIPARQRRRSGCGRLGRLSYVSGPSDDPLKFITIPQLLDRACARNGAGDAAIFVEQKLALSWYDLKKRADDVAAGLLALGIRRGDRVGIWSANRAEWLHAQFGTARIGAILVNVNPAYQASGA